MNDPHWRPTSFDQMIGQPQAKNALVVDVLAARQQQRAMPHRVFTGRPGLGKSLAARIMADQRGVAYCEIKGREANDHRALSFLLSQLDAVGYDLSDSDGVAYGRLLDRRSIRPAVVHIDEADGASRSTLQLLHDILEPTTGDGRRFFMAADPRVPAPFPMFVPELTVVFSTNFLSSIVRTNPAILSRCRPPIEFRLYGVDDLAKIIGQYAKRQGVAIADGAVEALADAAQGTPRTALQLFGSAHDQWVAHNHTAKRRSRSITREIAEAALERECYDRHGLSEKQREYLQILAESHEPKLGVENIAAMLGMDKASVEIAVEPYLLLRRFVIRASGGRRITDAGRKAIGAPVANPVLARARFGIGAA